MVELKVMYNDAQIARDTARAELSKLEQSVYEAKRERESQLMEYKKQAEEKKDHAEKVEKRVIIFKIQNTTGHLEGLNDNEVGILLRTFGMLLLLMLKSTLYLNVLLQNIFIRKHYKQYLYS